MWSLLMVMMTSGVRFVAFVKHDDHFVVDSSNSLRMFRTFVSHLDDDEVMESHRQIVVS